VKFSHFLGLCELTAPNHPSSLGLSLTIVYFFVNYRSRSYFEATFYHGKSYVIIFTKNWLGYTLGDFLQTLVLLHMSINIEREKFFCAFTRSNLAIVIYNAGAVKHYNATNNLVRFKTKKTPTYIISCLVRPSA
jgi:hypothetical protein